MGEEGIRSLIAASEKALLASLMLAPNTQTALSEIKQILPKDAIRSCVMSVIEKISDRGNVADPLAVATELKIQGRLQEIGGYEALTNWIETCPNIYAPRAYAQQILRLKGREQAEKLIREVGHKVQRGEELNGELEKLAIAISEISSTEDVAKQKSWKQMTGTEIFNATQLIELKDTPINYVLNPLAIRGCLTQIHGPPKGGKSTWALYLAVAGAWGFFPGTDSLVTVSQPLNVLYVSWEDSASLIARRICEYSAGLGLSGIPQNLKVSESPQLWLDREPYGDLLTSEIAASKYDLTILDTLSYAHAVDEDRADEIKPLMARLRSIARATGSSILYVHHRRKAFEGISFSERARGSTAISAAADVIIDWGDRGGANVTPVDWTSKWGRSGQWEVEYLPQLDMSVRWDIRSRGKHEEQEDAKERQSSDERKASVLKAIRDLALQGTIGVFGNQVVTIMQDKGLGKTITYRYLAELVNEGKLTEKVEGKGVKYEIKM